MVVWLEGGAYSGDPATGDHEIEHEDGEPPGLGVAERLDELVLFPDLCLRGVLGFFGAQGCECALLFVQEVCVVRGVGEKEP